MRRMKQETESMTVEILGGRDDGVRLTLEVVRDGETRLRVLAQNYTKRFKELRASEVEPVTRSRGG